MGGSILQLVATGIADMYLTGDPQITMFKVLYRRYTEFSMVDYPMNINGNLQFGDTFFVKVGPIADKLSILSLIVDVPTPEIKMKDPTVGTIKPIVEPYGLSLIFDPPKRDTDVVEYNDLFDDSIDSSLGVQMTQEAKRLDVIYDARLDMLEYVKNIYEVSDDQYIGSYIALKANQIIFSDIGDNIDKQGYLLLSSDKTKEIILSTTKIIDIDDSSYIFKLDENTDLTANRDFSFPLTYPLTPTKSKNIDKLVKVYPNILDGYTKISSIDDLNILASQDLSNERYHLILSVNYLRESIKRDNKLREIIVNLNNDPNDIIYRNSDSNASKNRPLLFTNFNILKMIEDVGYEIGYYKFNIQDGLPNDEYLIQLDGVLNTMKLNIDIAHIDKTSINANVGRLNRYDINENAIYDKTWEFTTNDEEELDGLSGNGYWMLDIKTIIDDFSNQNVIDITTANNLINGQQSINSYIVQFNPMFVHSNCDRIGYAPHTIKREWKDSIIQSTYIVDQDGNIIEIIKEKAKNMIDGITTVTKIFGDIYSVPGIENASNISELIEKLNPILTIFDVGSLHNLLLSMYDDMIDTQNQSRNYKIDNIKLYNAVDIRTVIYNKLVKDIIYVDQKKIGSKYDDYLNQFFRKLMFDNNNNITSDTYISNEQYIYDNIDPNIVTSEGIIHNRSIIYQYTKYLLWSYFMENIYIKYNPNNEGVIDFSEDLSKLSYLLFHVPINPISLDPTNVNGNGVIDETTIKIRFALNNINNITQTFIYDDESIYENYDFIHKYIGTNISSNDGKTVESEYIFSGIRYDENIGSNNNDGNNTVFMDGNGTCINRELEFYHIIYSFDHSNIYETNITVNDYFINKIINAYDDNRNYINTISYSTTKQYLNDYFSNTIIANSVISMEDVNNELLLLIERGVNLTITNYIKFIFYPWKNSTYNDSELLPQVIKVNDDEKSKSYIDYNSNYIINYLNANNIEIDPSFGFDIDPMLNRGKYYAGIDETKRPLIGYAYIYDINVMNVETYSNIIDLIIETSRFISTTDTLIQGSTFKDGFSFNVDTNVSKVLDDMETNVKLNDTIRETSSYIYWNDMNNIMMNVIDDINVDLNLVGNNELKYFNNTFLYNHMPVSIAYYWGNYMQQIILTLVDSTDTLKTSDVIVENIAYDFFPSDDINDIDGKKYNIVTDTIEGLYLEFLSTDVRLDPSCPFHSKVKNLSDFEVKYDNCNKYMQTNDYEYVKNDCPICFRTIEFMRLYDTILNKSLLNAKINDNESHRIIDYEYVNELINGSEDTYTIQGVSKYETMEKTAFLYRIEPVIYDLNSKLYFHSQIDFVVHRIATIFFRYKNMIDNIMNKDDVNYGQYLIDNEPLPTQITAPVNGKTEVDRFNDFKTYLTNMRSDSTNVDVFNEQMNYIISVITYTDNYPEQYEYVRSIFDVNRDEIIDYTYDDFGEAQLFLGGNADIYTSGGVGQYRMIPNRMYDNETSTEYLVRYQFYRGNILVWNQIQKSIIISYNNYFNSVLDPIEIDINSDLFFEMYNILKETMNDKFIYDNGTIDYYRDKQTRENGLIDVNESYNDFHETSTKMINYCRHLLIYYNMLLVRYRKLNFLLGVQTISLNNDAFYFEFSQVILKEYLNATLTTIQNMYINNINEQENDDINRDFYYIDTSQYYFINKTTFRNKIENVNNLALVTDFELFNYDNNYHLQQVFTVNQLNRLFAMLGINDALLQPYNDTKPNASKNYYGKIGNGIDVDYNQNFSFYITKSKDQDGLNDYTKYLYVKELIYENNTINYVPKIERKINNGLFNYVWKNYPTITNILYDIYYRVVILKSENPGLFGQPYETDTIIERTYTDCLVTSPLVYMLDKISHATINQFCHTDAMQKLEDLSHETIVNLFPNPILRYDAEIRFTQDLYNTYIFFVGSYKFSDIVNDLRNVRKEVLNPNGFFMVFLDKYNVLLNSIVENEINAFKIVDNNMRNQYIITSLTLEHIRTVPIMNNIIKEALDYSKKTIDDLNVFRERITSNSNNEQKQILINIIFNIIIEDITVFTVKFSKLSMSVDINNVKSNLNNISTIEEFTNYLKEKYVEIMNEYTDFQFNVFLQLNSLIGITTFGFIDSDIDDRIYTPSKLYNVRNLGLLNNLSSYKDMLMLLLSNIVAYITPLDANTISIFSPAININLFDIPALDVNSDIFNNSFVTQIDQASPSNTYYIILKNLKVSIDQVYLPMSDIAYLPRYIDSTREKVDEYYRYDLDMIIIENNTKVNKLKRKMQYITNSRGNVRNTIQDTGTISTYVGSKIYNQIIGILDKVVPYHAWVRYLGYRMIEEFSIIIDGEQIDTMDGDLMLLLHKLSDKKDHKRGHDIMIGHTQEMYGVSRDYRPSMRLYIQFKTFFSKDYGNSLNLVNMIYSDVKIKIKLRRFEELFYIENGGELTRPVKIKCHFLGNYIYLGNDERKVCASTRIDHLMERYMSDTTVKTRKDLVSNITTQNGTATDVIKIRYYFNDPCKYLMWKIDIVYPYPNEKDKIHWDLNNYRNRDSNGEITDKSKITEIVNRTMIMFNGKSREQWKDNMFFQTYHPITKHGNPLDSGEYIYSFSLFVNAPQPSGATNLSAIQDVQFYFEINPTISEMMKTNNIKLRFKMWECSYNIFTTVSGFGALKFYGVHTKY